jgi:uncharacterized repeat protein (TIGR01451 family)
LIKSQDSGKLKKTKNRTWIMVSVLAAVIIVCLAAYFYFFYFKDPGLAGMKSWITSSESTGALESAPAEGLAGQNEAKPDLSIVEVSVERVEIKANEGSTPTSGVGNTSTKKSDKIYIGDTVKFDILIKNNSFLPAKNIKIIDLPSDKLENINMSEGSGGSYDPFGRKIVLDIAEIGSGETIKVAFTGHISNDLNDGDIIENKVTALYTDAVIAEKSTELSVTGLPDYTATLVKVEDVNGSKIWARDILKYSIIVRNSGKKAGGSIVLNCPVPTGTGYVDGTASGSGLVISPNKSLIQFNIGKIEPGAQKEFSYKVFVAEYLTFSSDIKSGFFITDGVEKISLKNPSVTTEAYMFQTVVCMGDSQVVLSDYTTQLGMLLNNQYSHAVFNVIPTGVKGEMANFAIQRFDKDVRIHNPDIIVIGYGCNDAGEATGLYRYHMEILISQAVSTGAKVFVYGVGYIDMSIPKWFGKANYTILNEILKTDVCPKYGAVYVDLYSQMSKDYKKYIKKDGMHWTEEGATLVAGEVFKAITTVLDNDGKVLTEIEE